MALFHTPAQQPMVERLQRMLLEHPHARALRLLPLCMQGRMLGLRPTITEFALRQVDIAVSLTPPQDHREREQWTRAHAQTLVVDARGDAALAELLERLVIRAAPIREVLCMFANPEDRVPLALHHEWRAIDDANERAGRPLQIEARWAASVRDVQELRFARPRDVLHFSGHGEHEHLLFERANGCAQSVPTAKLLDVLAAARPQCLVFNACDSANRLERVRDRVPYVIAMHGPTDDRAAIEFSSAFYTALAHRQTIQSAFDYAVEAIGLRTLSEQCRPRLLC